MRKLLGSFKPSGMGGWGGGGLGWQGVKLSDNFNEIVRQLCSAPAALIVIQFGIAQTIQKISTILKITINLTLTA